MLNIKEQLDKKKAEFEAHIMGIAGALAGGVTIVSRDHLKEREMEFHVSPEVYDEVKRRVMGRLTTARLFDDHKTEEVNSMRAARV